MCAVCVGYLYAMGFCLLALLRSFAATRSQIMSLRTGIRVRHSFRLC